MRELFAKPEVRQFFVEAGRLGGQIGGKVTAKRRTPEERRAAALKAIQARWAKVRAAEKGKPRA